MSRPPRVPQVTLLIETSSAYGRGLVEGIGRYVHEHGPWSIYFERGGLRDPLPRWLRDWQGDGIISRTPRKADIEALLATGLPIVEMYADPCLGLPRVSPDQDAVAELAAEHFLERGLRSFGFFATERAWWIAARREAFVRILQRCGHCCITYEATRQKTRTTRRGSDQQDMVRWLATLAKPCGVFCASDIFALRLLEACRSTDILVPEQIAVLGVDNDPVICSVCSPPLSSIDMGSKRVGYQAAALLHHMMAGNPPPGRPILLEPAQVVTRQSTDVLAIEDREVARAVRFIREHACGGIHVQQVADAVALSRRSLERRVRFCLGRTPRQEVLRVQMERAKMLLSQTDMTIGTISRKCGFASLKYFSKVFHRESGITPRAYRGSRRIPTSHDVVDW